MIHQAADGRPRRVWLMGKREAVMSWILAVVGFAGVMAVLSTLVTVAVEAIHKTLAMRRSGLQEMMRAMHDNVVADWSPEKPVGHGDGRSKDAIAFARAMTRNPAFGGGGRWWWPRNWPLLRNVLFQPDLERLSALQFFEQLGQTDAGKAIVARPMQEVRQFVQRTAQEFERYGEMQSDYFGRRAKAISALAAFALVAFGNINAVPVFQWLAAQQDPVAAAARLQALQSNAATAAPAPGSATALYSANLQSLSLEGLPIGAAYFPYCNRSRTTPGCENATPAVTTFAGMVDIDFAVAQRVFSLDGLVWILSIIATAGLLGLGAPFWFQLFRSLGSATGGARTLAVAAPAPIQAANAVARPAQPNLDDLAHGLLRTAGAAPPPEAHSAAAGATTPSSGPIFGMRRVRS
jgi:hypothetical protein